MKSLVWAAEPVSRILATQLSGDVTVVTSIDEFKATPRDGGTVIFADTTSLGALAAQRVTEPVIAICEDGLDTALDWVVSRIWLSHVMSVTMLSHPMTAKLLENVGAALVKGKQPKLLEWVDSSATGRRVRLTHSGKRVERLGRLREFFTKSRLPEQTVERAVQVASELLTNAFYGAPVSAGVAKTTIPETTDVVLPNDSACDLAYAVRDGVAVVRVRDPFGSLTRLQLVEGLAPKSPDQHSTAATLRRVFSLGSFVAVSVDSNRRTEVLVGITEPGLEHPAPYSIHLFFKERGRPVRRWRLRDLHEDTGNPSVNNSIAIFNK